MLLIFLNFYFAVEELIFCCFDLVVEGCFLGKCDWSWREELHPPVVL